MYFVGQNCQKVGPKETKIEKIDKTSDFKLFNFFIQKAKNGQKFGNQARIYLRNQARIGKKSIYR